MAKDIMDDGGYMFPRNLPDTPVPLDEALALIRSYSGCTLHDWFAGIAMAALAPLVQKKLVHEDDVGKRYSASDVAYDAYLFADHMLAEKDKRDQMESRGG